MRRYETIFIIPADLPSEEIEGIIEHYKTIITSQNGVVVKVDNWGKRKLAYSIQKRNTGNYILIDFVGEHKVLAEFERNLKYDESVLRFQSVNLSEKVEMEEIEREIADMKKKGTVSDVSHKAEKVEDVNTSKELEKNITSEVEEPLAKSEEKTVTEEDEGVEE
ncbi:MAG: 30S ribosomal protein S6 [Syntrophobacterales bacterium]|nr:30S ribosomal protein S6 [Syntrophobacterales bacterium]OPX37808.1 MAG: 30S ribosomal protein S6 [Desulfobacteraceae bacterium 4484_190.3]